MLPVSKLPFRLFQNILMNLWEEPDPVVGAGIVAAAEKGRIPAVTGLTVE